MEEKNKIKALGMERCQKIGILHTNKINDYYYYHHH